MAWQSQCLLCDNANKREAKFYLPSPLSPRAHHRRIYYLPALVASQPYDHLARRTRFEAEKKAPAPPNIQQMSFAINVEN